MESLTTQDLIKCPICQYIEYLKEHIIATVGKGQKAK